MSHFVGFTHGDDDDSNHSFAKIHLYKSHVFCVFTNGVVRNLSVLVLHRHCTQYVVNLGTPIIEQKMGIRHPNGDQYNGNTNCWDDYCAVDADESGNTVQAK